MAISRIGTPGTGTTSCTFPTHQAGDLLIVFAFRDGSNTAPSLPATWWNYFTETGANTCSIRVGYKIATGAGTASGTWTNATSVIGAVYRGAVLGALISSRGSSTTFSYAAIPVISYSNNTSWVGAFVASRDGTNTSVPNVQIAPTGMTNVVSVKDATDAAGMHDTNGTVSSWSVQTQATGVAATGWYTFVFELVEVQASILGYNVIGASTNTLTDYFVGASFDCTQAFTAISGKFYGNQNSGSGTYDFAIYEETSLNNYTFLSQATGTITVGTTPGWNSFTISQALTVGTRYFIAFWSADPFTFYFNTGARVGTTYATTGNTFNTWPTPESGGITDVAFISIYIENDASVSVAPGVGQPVFTGIVPTINVSNNISVAPGLSQPVFTGFVPVANITVDARPGLGEPIYSGFAPTVNISDNISVSPGVGQGLFTGVSPSVDISDNISVSTGFGQAVFSGFSPSIDVSNHINILPGLGEPVFSGLTPTLNISNNINVFPGASNAAFSGFSPTVNVSDHINVNTQTGTSIFTGIAPQVDISNHISVAPGTATSTFTGYEPVINTSQSVSPGTGQAVFTGFAPSIVVGAVMPKPSHTINFTFVKQSHVVNFVSIVQQHSINFTFVKTSHTIDTE